MSSTPTNEVEKIEVYPFCTTKENPFALADLCKHCPIPKSIEVALPRVIAEIETRRQADTRAGFRQYCKTSLATHVKQAAQAANDLANPWKKASLNTSKVLQHKFWNLAACELYRRELEPKRKPIAPTATLTPADPLPTLPHDVAERLAYFDMLLADCRRAEHPHDMAQVLRAAYEERKSRGLYAVEDFMERLHTYVLAKLPEALRSQLENSVMRSLRGQFRIFRLKPETWPVWMLTQRGYLLERQQDVHERLARAEPGSRDETDHRATLARIGRILAALDTAAAAGIAFVAARGLTQPASLTAPAATAPAPVSTPEPNANTHTVADLCRNDFTPADLTDLLQRLGMVDASGNCLTNDLRGKDRGRLGAFTAAYRVLHRAELLAPTRNNKQWAAALKKEYGVSLGADVTAHQLTPHGHAAPLSPGPFQKAVDIANAWVSEWKSRRKSEFIAP